MPRLRSILVIASFLVGAAVLHAQPANLIRTAKSGPWSDGATWEGGKVPGTGARVQIREGHNVLYNVKPEHVIRFIHVAGTLRFANDMDTLLNVGLIKIQSGADASEDGFDCDAHMKPAKAGTERPALEVGTPDFPVDAKHTAMIRLHYIAGMDKQSCPAIVCCGGRMDFHGTPMSRTWVKLGGMAKAGATDVTLEETVSGWKVGDRVIVTATVRQNKVKKTFRDSVKDNTQTEERIIKAIAGAKVTLDQPLKFDHEGDGDYRAEVANLSRNVVVESAKDDAHGHTMYHHGSAGSIAYAEGL
jgi:G8 domain